MIRDELHKKLRLHSSPELFFWVTKANKVTQIPINSLMLIVLPASSFDLRALYRFSALHDGMIWLSIDWLTLGAQINWIIITRAEKSLVAIVQLPDPHEHNNFPPQFKYFARPKATHIIKPYRIYVRTVWNLISHFYSFSLDTTRKSLLGRAWTSVRKLKLRNQHHLSSLIILRSHYWS